MKSVAIIGAGPAGLVTAKTLLRAQKGAAFSVSVFEKSSRLGGIWALDETPSSDGFLAASTPTNLSQFQVCFSDLAWASVDCESRASSGSQFHKPPATASIFPKAWQANRYLNAYASKFIPAGVIEFDSEVTSTRRVANDQSHQWHVTVSAAGNGEETRVFDHLVIASGFFSRPRVPADALNPFANSSDPAPVKTIHTSQFRSLHDLFTDHAHPRGKKILIFGGGNSVGETAGTVAHALSSARNSSRAGADRYAGCHLVQVTPRPLYGIPPYIPASEDSTGFIPVDCRFYDLSARPPAEIVSSAGRMSAELIKFIHTGAQKYVGGNQSDLGANGLTLKDVDTARTIQVALSENFSEFVRAGDIKLVGGRVVKIEHDTGTASVRALVKTQETETWINDIGAVIHATGYTPFEALSFLPEDVKEALEYDPSSHRLPLILDEMQTIAPSMPELGFVGFYEGPYWGMMEMQARLITQRWLGKLSGIQRPSEAKAQLRSLRQGMADRDADVPQYWLGDYLGHMEHFSRDLKLVRNDAPFSGPRKGILLPSRFLDEGSDVEEAKTMMEKVFDTLEASKQGAFVARAVVRALHGKWSMHRRIDSVASDFPSGAFEGTAQFHPRVPTSSSQEAPFDLEMLYVESGAFIADSGLSFTASRRYVYRYRESNDELSVWFVKDDGFTVDYLFHSLTFSAPPGPDGDGKYIAKGSHMCVEDEYTSQYEFEFRGVALQNFRLKHSVEGPKKDYVSDTRHERPEP